MNPQELRARALARTQLVVSLADEGLSAAEFCDAVSGVRSVADVMADRDRRLASLTHTTNGEING